MVKLKRKDYSKIPEADVVLDYIEKRKNKGLYTLILTSGLPGTGKSSTDIRLAELITKRLCGENKFTVDNIIDDLLGLIEFIKNADPDEVNVAVVEEVSVLFPSRRAMSHDNVAVAKLLDTARKKQVILFANAPLWTSIDSHMRALGNIYIETLKVVKRQKVVVSKALRLQTNPGSGKTYFHWLKRKGREVHRIITRKPSKETWEKYENAKDKFMDEMYELVKAKTQKKKKKNKRIIAKNKISKTKIDDQLTKRELEVYDLYFKQKKRNKDIAEELDVSTSAVSQMCKKIRRKLNHPQKNG